MTASAPADRIPSADPQLSAERKYDIAIIGSGILGSVLATTLAQSGRSVVLLERDLTEPDRIVGELLQPGGCIALRKMGLDDTLEGIDAVEVDGYKVFWGEQEVAIPYPEESIPMGWTDELAKGGRQQQGRSFHHGRFIQNLRKRAQATEGVTLVEATVNELSHDAAGTIVGLTATPRRQAPGDPQPSRLEFKASLTLIADGWASKFRREILPEHHLATVRSNFVGLVLVDADLPAPHHGHVILGKPDPTAPPRDPNSTTPDVGPVLVYQLATHETRMLVDVRGPKVPGNAELGPWLRKHVPPKLPPSIVPSFLAALDRAAAKEARAEDRLRTMPNSFLPPYPQGRDVQGAFLVGDSLNMRHPLTGGGMTVAFNDALILTEILGGDNKVGVLAADFRGVVELESWLDVSERLEEWHWKRKSTASCINVLAMALYSLFGADDENLEVLKTGCFRYFERGGECVAGPVALLSALRPSPLLLFYHFFSVAFYSIYTLFTQPTFVTGGKTPGLAQYPGLTIRSVRVFWAACVVLLPVLWSEAQM